MWSKSLVSLLFLSGMISVSRAQIRSFEIICNYDTTRIMDIEGYSCILSDLEYDFNTPFYFIRVGGVHQEGMTNDDVRLIRITNSRINRIPANIFNVFPNAEALEIMNCGNISIIPPDFFFADNLKVIHFELNTIPRIGVNTFISCRSLEALYLDNNRIEDLGPAPFVGLTNLVHISIANNRIRNLSQRILRPVPNLRIFAAPDNLLEEIDGRLFVNNPNLLTVNFEGNNISAVGASFLNINENVEFLFLANNDCVDRNFEGAQTNLNAIREALQECFANSPFGTQITLNVLGSLTIFGENDEVLLRLD